MKIEYLEQMVKMMRGVTNAKCLDNGLLIALIDRVRMLDNDIIRLRSKVNTVLELREKEKKTPSRKRNT
jgi:hypothetical protein